MAVKILPKKQKNSSTELKLDEMKQKLEDFILNDKTFFNLAKKYTFQYREFSSITDYCHVQWKKKEKNWECIGDGYFCDDSQTLLPGKKTNSFLINLSITGYTWSHIIDVMEKKFLENLKDSMAEEDMEDFQTEKYDEYLKLRDSFFKRKKIDIIDNWFVFYEKFPQGTDRIKSNIVEFIDQELKRLEEQFLTKKLLSY